MDMGGKRGLAVKWAAGITGMLFVGGGNILGTMIQKLMYGSGALWENALAGRWCATIAVWAVGAALSATIYALGAAMERIDVLEMWLMSLDTAVRNGNAQEKTE